MPWRNFENSAIELTDLDGDLDLDVVIHANETLWFENVDGKGAFGPSKPIGEDTGTLVVTDLDGDNDPDIAVGGRRGVIWYENNGAGEFVRYEIETDVAVSGLTAADMDGDGDSDLLTSINREVYLITNLDDSNSFAARTKLGPVSYFAWTAIDIDQDDDVDLVYLAFSSMTGLTLHWLENEQGIFDTSRVLATHVRTAFEFGDIDRDGDIDVLTGVRWNEQRTIGDVNGDGRFDSADFVVVFSRGEYEDAHPGNSTWHDGDWNQDGDFDSADLVLAFQANTYTHQARAVRANVAGAIVGVDREKKERNDRAR
jgi:hypothetical protein